MPSGFQLHQRLSQLVYDKARECTPQPGWDRHNELVRTVLENQLKYKWQNSRVVIYGSGASGMLVSSGSDVDLYFECPEFLNKYERIRNQLTKAEEELESLQQRYGDFASEVRQHTVKMGPQVGRMKDLRQSHDSKQRKIHSLTKSIAKLQAIIPAKSKAGSGKGGAGNVKGEGEGEGEAIRELKDYQIQLKFEKKRLATVEIDLVEASIEVEKLTKKKKESDEYLANLPGFRQLQLAKAKVEEAKDAEMRWKKTIFKLQYKLQQLRGKFRIEGAQPIWRARVPDRKSVV